MKQFSTATKHTILEDALDLGDISEVDLVPESWGCPQCNNRDEDTLVRIWSGTYPEDGSEWVVTECKQCSATYEAMTSPPSSESVAKGQD